MSEKIISTVFKNYAEADRFVTDAYAHGITQEQISVVTSDKTHLKEFSVESNNKAPEGATAGAMVGGSLGGIAIGLASAAALSIPGLNIIAAGPILVVAAGIGAGGFAGGITGALVGMGYPEHEAKIFQDEVSKGNILVAVKANDNQTDRIKTLFDKYEQTSLKTISV